MKNLTASSYIGPRRAANSGKTCSLFSSCWSKPRISSHWHANSVASERAFGLASMPPDLGRQDLRLVELALRRKAPQLRVRHRRPEEVAEAAGELPVGDGPWFGAFRRLLGPVEEGRGDEDPGQRQANRRIVVQVLLAEPGVEALQLPPLMVAQRAAVGPFRELQHRVEVLRPRVDELLPQGRGAVGDRLLEVLEQVGVAILRRVFHELDVAHLDLERLLADVPELLPEPLQRPALGLVEHEPGEVLILAMVEGQGHHLIDRHDLAVAEGRGEEAAEIVERRLEASPCRAPAADQDGSSRRHPVLSRGLIDEHLDLHAPLGAVAPRRARRT